jgi:hypothetical protein
MNEANPSKFCFMIRKGNPCVKSKVAKKHLPYYECDKCIWHIKSEDERHLNSLNRLYQKYGHKKWD